MFEIEFDTTGALFSPNAAEVVERAAQEVAHQIAEDGAAKARASTAFKDGSGDLRRSVQAVVEGSFLDDTLYAIVRADSEVASFVNDGTKPHVIRPKRAKALQLKSLGDGVFASRVNHPGTQATHFIDESIDPEQAQELLTNKVADALTK